MVKNSIVIAIVPDWSIISFDTGGYTIVIIITIEIIRNPIVISIWIHSRLFWLLIFTLGRYTIIIIITVEIIRNPIVISIFMYSWILWIM